jgi:hypothetical protein
VPESEQPIAGRDLMVEHILALKPDGVIDVGAGEGKWGRLLRDRVRIDALEIWPPYVERFPLGELYAGVHVADAREFGAWDEYEAAILGDVLEHMPKDDARALVDRMLAAGLTLFLSIPVTDCPQRGEPFGNPYEEHVAQWTHEELIDDGWRELHRGPVPSGLATVGTYWRRRDMPPLASILIPTRNRWRLLEMTLRSIEAQRYAETEVVVLDDASTDETRWMLADYPGVRSERIERAGGYRADTGELFNQLMAMGRGDVLIQQSAEVVHLTPLARQLLEACEPGAAAFATVLAGGEQQLLAVEQAVAAGWNAGECLYQPPYLGVIDPEGRRPDGGEGTVAPPVAIEVGRQAVEVYSGRARPAPLFFAGAITHADWLRTGGYPEGNPHGASDLHLAIRMMRLGMFFKFLGGAVGFHIAHDKS